MTLLLSSGAAVLVYLSLMHRAFSSVFMTTIMLE